MNDGTLRRIVTRPIRRPISALTASATPIAAMIGNPAASANPMTNGASANTCPTDRSISRQISSMISPQAMITGAATNCDKVSMLSALRKFGLASSK